MGIQMEFPNGSNDVHVIGDTQMISLHQTPVKIYDPLTNYIIDDQ
jgi:hypothetical protein